ncbi:hypothetical protein LCGC14_2628310 [marine sediment metagenome]|uniref:Uncharacterized protein n=1 Tax=marine sediment metagenome TaxID=412755 RepID=A0A0F9A113_9ZZZZ
MGAPVPPPPPPHLGGPSGSYGNWKSEEAKRRYVGMLEDRVAASPPTWLIVGGIVAVFVLLAVMLWSIR